jgi:hypothetical protein
MGDIREKEGAKTGFDRQHRPSARATLDGRTEGWTSCDRTRNGGKPSVAGDQSLDSFFLYYLAEIKRGITANNLVPKFRGMFIQVI